MRTMASNKKTARIAGLMYLLFIIFTFVSDHFAAFTAPEPATVISKIIINPTMFSFGAVCNLLSGLFFLLAAWMLYELLKPVNKGMALLFLLLNLTGVVIQCVSVLNLFAAKNLLSGAKYLSIFSTDQLASQSIFLVKAYEVGILSAQLFFGAWMLPLGYTVYRSGFLPKFLGILLMADFVAILIWFFQYFLMPKYIAISYPCMLVSLVAEFGLTCWLLIKGASDPEDTAVA